MLVLLLLDLGVVFFRRRRLPQKEAAATCGRAEWWLSPFLRCSTSIFWRNPGEVPLKSRSNSGEFLVKRADKQEAHSKNAITQPARAHEAARFIVNAANLIAPVMEKTPVLGFDWASGSAGSGGGGVVYKSGLFCALDSIYNRYSHYSIGQFSEGLETTIFGVLGFDWATDSAGSGGNCAHPTYMWVHDNYSLQFVDVSMSNASSRLAKP